MSITSPTPANPTPAVEPGDQKPAVEPANQKPAVEPANQKPAVEPGFLLRLGLSFVYAGRGLRLLIASESNARWHLVASITTLALGIWLKLLPGEWIAVLLCFGLVWSAEATNTAIEWLCDLVQPERDERVRNIKDVGAAGVLVAAICAAVVGLIIFLPKILDRFYLGEW